MRPPWPVLRFLPALLPDQGRDASRRASPSLLCRADDKPAALLYLVRELIPSGQPTIIFVSTRHHVDFLSGVLGKAGIQAACVYGTMDQVWWAAAVLGKFFWGRFRGQLFWSFLPMFQPSPLPGAPTPAPKLQLALTMVHGP